MGDSVEQLLSGLQTGFIDKSVISNAEYLPEILTNDLKRKRKVLTTIHRELSECDEFWISVAFLTMSGFASLVNKLLELQDRNTKGKILVSQYLNFTQPEALKKLSKFTNIELKIINTDNFHSKGYLFKKGQYYSLIIGSSNLTAGALSTNQELNLKVKAHADSKIIQSFFDEFQSSNNKAIGVTNEYLNDYTKIYNNKIITENNIRETVKPDSEKLFSPNKMQSEALIRMKELRNVDADKAILISATGTGKTLLSAFDAKEFNPKKFLFVVHRENIARASLSEYKRVFGANLNCGIYIGSDRNTEADYIFSTIQTLSRDNHLHKFQPDHFDYVVIDETHRSGAKSYKKVINYFKPKFLLGMTATPDRTDGYDIFTHFDHNIAYEIRLHKALSENMLSPFHYYGVTDIVVDGKSIDENANFNMLTKEERVDRIIEKIKFYGTCDGITRGLIFCSRKEEAKTLSMMFNDRGFNTICLTGENSEDDRIEAINRLETNDVESKIDYIFTVDIFNEGIDIPKINQIIMLRPTQSAIIFVQQLGRGLRKVENKDYLTVIDFIGNYNNNYLIPIALFGDKSYNKDTIRKLIVSGNEMIPGSSTISFDKITQERIFKSIDNTNMQTKRDLARDYELLKYKIGKTPTMVDFIKHEGRDPYSFVSYSKSYFNFVHIMGDQKGESLSEIQKLLLEIFSQHINNSKRLEESFILKELIHSSNTDIDLIKSKIEKIYGYKPSAKNIESAIHNLNLNYNTINKNRKLSRCRELIRYDMVIREDNELKLSEFLSTQLKNKIFKKYLLDSTYYSRRKFKSLFKTENYIDGFVLYRKYSRKDVFRILGHDKQPVGLNVGGYLISPDKSNCPLFVNYYKLEDISSTTKYEDKFLNNYTLQWESKSNRTLDSADVLAIKNEKNMRIPLFIKKSNDEGDDHYYMGDVKPIDDSFKQESIDDKPVVRLQFSLDKPVEKSLYNYITTNE
jgi:superfamily II DNA or RNA helicase